MVAVFQAGDGAPTGVMASLAGGRAALLDDLMGWAAAQGDAVGRLRLWSGGGGRIAFLGAAPGPDGSGGALDTVVDRLLESLLLGQRAVRRWRTQFLAVVETTDGDALPAADAVFVPAGAEERLYAAPHRRDLLAPAAPDGHPCALRSFRVPCAGLALRISRAEGGPPVADVSVPLFDVMVHTAGGRLAVLEWACEGGVAEAGDDSAPRWPRLMEEARALAALPPGTVATVAQGMDFNEAARTLYAPYAAAGARRDVALVQDERARVVAALNAR